MIPNDSIASVEVGSAQAPGRAEDRLVSIVVPTYREAENLPVLLPRVAQALEDRGLRWEAIVVDDDSRDGTEETCSALAASLPVRLVVRRGERGLSSAVLAGMRHARGDVFVVMDADLSHPPETIADLVDAVRTGRGDFAIGSRYVPGASTDERWGAFRRLNSRGATLLARPLTRARDPMAGFFALTRRTFEKAARLNPVGYKIGLELMVKCRCRRVVEVPIHFAERSRGSSKLTWREQFNYLKHLKRLYEFRLGRLAQPVQFLVVGATGVVVDLTIFGLLLRFVPMTYARGAAIAVAMTWNFWLNRRLTFSDSRSSAWPRQYALFVLSCIVGATVNWFVSVTLVRGAPFFDRWKVAAALAGIVAGTAFNYVLSARVVFRHRRP